MQSVFLLTIASKWWAIALANVVWPDVGGPTTHILQGIRGYGGNRYGRGLKINFFIASMDDKQYILSINLNKEKIHIYVIILNNNALNIFRVSN